MFVEPNTNVDSQQFFSDGKKLIDSFSLSSNNLQNLHTVLACNTNTIYHLLYPLTNIYLYLLCKTCFSPLGLSSVALSLVQLYVVIILHIKCIVMEI
jgi:hypothetical protein